MIFASHFMKLFTSLCILWMFYCPICRTKVGPCVRIYDVYVCVCVCLFQDELDLSEEHRANMFALPAEKKWQIYCSKKMVPTSVNGRMSFLFER